MAKKLIDLVKRKFSESVLQSHSRLGNDTVVIASEKVAEVIAFLRDDPGAKMNFLRDITAVDYMHRAPRFDVVYILYSMEHKHMLTVRTGLGESDISVPSISHLYGTAGWLEREVYDMYGVDFKGHPDLRRVLLYEEFEGHPLRKDYAIQASQPRMELLAPERDAVEEFLHYVKEEERAAGSRPMD